MHIKASRYNLHRINKLLLINNIKSLTIIRGDQEQFKGSNTHFAKSLSKKFKKYFPLYPEHHKHTLSHKFEYYRNKRKKTIANNWITQATYNIKKLITIKKITNTKTSNIKIGIPLIYKRTKIKHFNTRCAVYSTPSVKTNTNYKTTLILKLIKTILKLGFKKLKLFTQNKINVIKATFKILKQINKNENTFKSSDNRSKRTSGKHSI
ncbi:hypothetical protein ACWNX2_00265 [Candidatus Vidania fulgoroideorum]